MNIGQIVLALYMSFFLIYLYAPLGLLSYLSFNDNSIMSPIWSGFTLKWYGQVFRNDALLTAVAHSVVLGLVSTVVATTLGTMIAIGIRQRMPFSGLVMKMMLVPIVIPGVVAGVVYTIFFGMGGISLGLWTTVLIAHITWVLPFAFLTIFPRIMTLDPSLEEAAMDLGATRWRVFRRVILPLIRKPMIATALFGFTLSFDEFIRTFFASGAQRTIPVYLWDLLSNQMAPFLPAVGVFVTAISVGVSLIGFGVSAWAGRARA